MRITSEQEHIYHLYLFYVILMCMQCFQDFIFSKCEWRKDMTLRQWEEILLLDVVKNKKVETSDNRTSIQNQLKHLPMCHQRLSNKHHDWF
jgi:hypothetical protein